MRFIVHYGRTFTLLLVLFPLLGLGASFLYTQYAQTKQEIVRIVENEVFEKKYALLDIFTKHLQNEFGEDYISILRSNDKLRKKAEVSLSLLKDSEVQYLYLLYIDKNNKMRYLLDTTEDINEKGEFQQQFYPQKDIWKKTMLSQLPETATQKELDTLWISMAYPIIKNSKTIAIFGLDFSHKKYLKVKETLIPLERTYFYSVIFILVMLISGFIQLVMYYIHRKKSFIDPLTGMYNRQYLQELLHKYPVSEFQVLIMDLDHFKKVNDIYGHDAGDIVLRTVSARIQSAIRKQDILIRYGGEEFILLISNKDNNAKTSLALANRIREKVKEHPITLEECQLNVNISMGLNPVPQESKTFDHAVKIADLGLYKAKQLGRDRVEIYESDSNEADMDAQLQICDVRDALDLNNIFCVYQPIFCAKTMKIDKYELLLRMYDTKGEVILPSRFLPSVRYTQIYINLTKKVIEFAYEALSSSDAKININLDLQDLFNDEIIDYILEKFHTNKSLANRLTLEILEYEEILEFEIISQRLQKLKKLGIRVAIDDFGSGFASYRYILNIDVDVLKIDGSLIKDIHKNEDAQKILTSIQSLATSMDIQTVAEHVETKEDLECVTRLNIDYIQGYYLSKPVDDIS